mmetsp:Transcript_19298/g.41502  ORF Transcript_19298/g.41502 Transcript_19298/m.41502 type:complete len:296 (-) Transcript_19298:108-995(-)
MSTELHRYFHQILEENAIAIDCGSAQPQSPPTLIRDDALSHHSSSSSFSFTSDQSMNSNSGTFINHNSPFISKKKLGDVNNNNNTSLVNMIMSPSLNAAQNRTISLQTLPSLNRQSPVSRWDSVVSSSIKATEEKQNTKTALSPGMSPVSSLSPPYRPRRSSSQEGSSLVEEGQRPPDVTTTTTTSAAAAMAISPMSPTSPATALSKRIPSRASSTGGLPCISLYEEDDEKEDDKDSSDDNNMLGQHQEGAALSSRARKSKSSSRKSRKSSSSGKRGGSKRGSQRERRKSDPTSA